MFSGEARGSEVRRKATPVTKRIRRARETARGAGRTDLPYVGAARRER